MMSISLFWQAFWAYHERSSVSRSTGSQICANVCRPFPFSQVLVECCTLRVKKFTPCYTLRPKSCGGRWGSLINSSGEAAESTHKINVKGPGVNLNHRDTDGGTLLGHARRKETVKMLAGAIQGNV